MNTWQDNAAIAWDALSWKGTLRWFASRMERNKKRVMGGVLPNAESLLGTIRNAEALGWDLYLQLNPSDATGIKASRDDILQWRYAVLDLDPDGTELAPPYPSLAFDHHEIFSGRGYQYWLPIAEGDAFISALEAERLMNGWLHAFKEQITTPGWHVDTACSDIARVVRCPGSINQKTGQRAEYIIGKSSTSTGRISASFMRSYLRPMPEPPSKFEGNSSSLVELLPHLNGTATTFLLYGVEQGKRHNACYAACRNLKEIGVSSYHALAHLAAGGARCYMIYAEDGEEGRAHLPVEEIERIVKRVYADGS